MWYLFDNREAFDAWHEPTKQQLGIPMADGITIQYTELRESFDGRLVAWVDDDLANGLTPTDAPTNPPRDTV